MRSKADQICTHSACPHPKPWEDLSLYRRPFLPSLEAFWTEKFKWHGAHDSRRFKNWKIHSTHDATHHNTSKIFWGEETEHFSDWTRLLYPFKYQQRGQFSAVEQNITKWWIDCRKSQRKRWWRCECRCRAIKQLVRRQMKWHLLLATVVAGRAAEHVQMRWRKPLQEGVGGWNPALWNTVDVPLIWASSYTSLISENWEHVCQVGWFQPRACTSYRTVWWVEEQFLSS